jgi:ActR/RegA family two-component response regulator
MAGRAADILLLEDDQVYARLLREHFEGMGLSMTVAGYVGQALEPIRR